MCGPASPWKFLFHSDTLDAMRSAPACPSCQLLGPFESNVCPKCQAPLFFQATAIEPDRCTRAEADTENWKCSVATKIQWVVQTHYHQAQQDYPQVRLTPEAFLQKIVDVLEKRTRHLQVKSTDPEEDATTAQLLDTLKWHELFLTTACAEGDEAAWQVFLSQFQRVIQKAARYYAENPETNDLSDSFLTDLFLPAHPESGKKSSKIGQYDGIGSLEGWIKVVVSRMAVDRIRKSQRQISLEDLDTEPVSPHADGLNTGGAQEIEIKKASTMFASSLSQAIDQLTAQEKLILNLYYFKEVNLKDIGRLLKVHESTVSRTVDRLKKQLRKSVEKYLREHFQVRSSEIGQIIEMAQFQTELDFKKILAE